MASIIVTTKTAKASLCCKQCLAYPVGGVLGIILLHVAQVVLPGGEALLSLLCACVAGQQSGWCRPCLSQLSPHPDRNCTVPLHRWNTLCCASASTPRRPALGWPVIRTEQPPLQHCGLLQRLTRPSTTAAPKYLCFEQLLLMLLPQLMVCCAAADCCKQHKQEGCLETHLDTVLCVNTLLPLLSLTLSSCMG